MARYVSLINWTEQGVRGYRDTLDRAEAAGKIGEQMGGSLTDIYWTLGEQDIVAIMDFPDDQIQELKALYGSVPALKKKR